MMYSAIFSFEELSQLLLLFCFSISLSLLGTFLYLRKKSMIANAISHTILFGIALVFLVTKYFYPDMHFHEFSINRYFYVLTGFVTAIFTLLCIEGLKKYALLKDDASMAFVFSTLFSLGVIAITMFTRSTHIGVDVVVGNLDLVDIDDVKMALFMMLLTIVFSSIFFYDLVALSFDENIVYFSAKRGFLLQIAFLFLMSFVITTGFRFIGIAPTLGLIIIPPLTGSFFCKSSLDLIKFSIISNLVIGFLCFLLVKYLYEIHGFAVSTSGMLISLHFVLFLYYFKEDTREKTA